MRDLIGYGFAPPRVAWPNGVRLAVSINVNYEEGAEFSIENGDPRSEIFGEVRSVVPPGRRDLGQEELFAYCMRAGLPRILGALERHRIPATFMMCGRAVERTEILRTRDVIAQVTGETPVGFMCRGSQSLFTRSILADEGFLDDSNGFYDDLPYWDTGSGARPILVVSYAFDTNDMKFYHPNGFKTPEDFLGDLRRALEVLLAECDAGATKLMNVGPHLRIVGRPARFWVVQKFFEDLESLSDRIRLARRREIAAHWIAALPPPARALPLG